MAKPGSGMDEEAMKGGSGEGDPGDDFADQMQGNNQLQGDDQLSVHNQRSTMPGESDRTEGVVESFERMDPRKRTER